MEVAEIDLRVLNTFFDLTNALSAHAEELPEPVLSAYKEFTEASQAKQNQMFGAKG